MCGKILENFCKIKKIKGLRFGSIAEISSRNVQQKHNWDAIENVGNFNKSKSK